MIGLILAVIIGNFIFDILNLFLGDIYLQIKKRLSKTRG